MKKKILHLCGFLILIGVLCTSFIITKPKKQVKADTPELYYFDIDTSHESFMNIILYVLDVVNLEEDSCSMSIYLTLSSPPYSGTITATTIQFVRNSNLDYNDYHAYLFSYNYPAFGSTPTVMIVQSYGVLGFDDTQHTKVSYNVYIPYYPTFAVYEQAGYNRGYDDGEEDATNERNAYWEQYIEDEYVDPQGPGYQIIYQHGRSDGFTAGQQSLDTMTWFQTITSGVSNIFSLQLLPSITIGALIFIPLMFMILSGVLWIWRKK